MSYPRKCKQCRTNWSPDDFCSSICATNFMQTNAHPLLVCSSAVPQFGKILEDYVNFDIYIGDVGEIQLLDGTGWATILFPNGIKLMLAPAQWERAARPLPDLTAFKQATSEVLQAHAPTLSKLTDGPRLTLPIDSQARKEVPLLSGCLRYFPAALAGVAKISKLGNDKHNPGQEMHHARGKSTDHGDCVLRHLVDLQDLLAANNVDSNAICVEASSLAWRALALSQELHERFGAPLAPGAKVEPAGQS